jgi:hypothetical protein
LIVNVVAMATPIQKSKWIAIMQPKKITAKCNAK